MLLAWTLLIVSLAVILAGCDIFTNSVEWAGKKLHLGEGAVGSILAAVGTCLPETLIAILALVLGERMGAGSHVGIGAILGAPMMLSTLAFFVTGLFVLIFSGMHLRTTTMMVNYKVLARDLRFFFVVFALAAAASFLPGRSLNMVSAALLVAIYLAYVRATLADTSHSGSHEDISPLHFARRALEPPGWAVGAQAVVGLAVLVFGAHLFVGELTAIGNATGISLLVLSLIITPVATELPEKFNSILWVRRRKDTLALGNISGAMVFQSSIPPAVGLAFTSWDLDTAAIVAVAVTLLSSATVMIEMTIHRRVTPWSLMSGGIFYVGYIAWVLLAAPRPHG